MGLDRSWQLVRGRSVTAFWATFWPTIAAAIVALIQWRYGGGAWRLAEIAYGPLLLTYSAAVAVVLYRWLVTVSVPGHGALPPELEDHGGAYDTRGELGSRLHG